MYIIQILLPLFDNHGVQFEPQAYASVRSELTRLYGGLTTYSRAPAEGLWENAGDVRRNDGDALFEIFTERRAIRKSIVEMGQDSPVPDFGRPHPGLPGDALPRPYAGDGE